jgi:hypothetical protein
MLATMNQRPRGLPDLEPITLPSFRQLLTSLGPFAEAHQFPRDDTNNDPDPTPSPLTSSHASTMPDSSSELQRSFVSQGSSSLNRRSWSFVDEYNAQSTRTIQPRPRHRSLRSTSSTPSVSLPETDLTLAGKPRRRTAQACRRCREMKLKCRMHGEDTCSNCHRRGSECVFAEPPSGLRQSRSRRAVKGEGQTETAADSNKVVNADVSVRGSKDWRSMAASASISRQEVMTSSREPISQSASEVSTPATTEAAPSAQKATYGSIRAGASIPDTKTKLPVRPSLSQQPETNHTDLNLSINTDPYRLYPDLVETYTTAFYDHLDNIASNSDHASFLPTREEFLPWAQVTTIRATRQRILVFAVAAAGSSMIARGLVMPKSAAEPEVYFNKTIEKAMRARRAEDERAAAVEARRHSRAFRRVLDEALRKTKYSFDEITVQSRYVLRLIDEERSDGSEADGGG